MNQQQMNQQQMQQQQMNQQQMQQHQYRQQMPSQIYDDQQNSSSENEVINKLNNIEQNDLLKLLNSYANNEQTRRENPQPQVQPQVQRREEPVQKQGKQDKVSEYLSDLTRKQLEQLRQVQSLQEQLQTHIKSQMLNPTSYSNNNEQKPRQNELNDQLKNELVSKVKILTGQLEQQKKVNIDLRTRLDEIIENNNNENDRKLTLIDNKKNEIRSEVHQLSNKHKEIEKSYNSLIKKEKFIAAIIEKNRKIIQADKTTLFIDSKIHNLESKLVYLLDNKLQDISKIELISYDFPLTSNNINSTNNKLYFKFDSDAETVEPVQKDDTNSSDSEEVAIDTNDDFNVINIPHGNYDISTLIKKLNKLGKTFNLVFSYNKNSSKVTIKSEISFTLFKKESNVLDILGFNSVELENKKLYQGDNPYDLRKCNYAYIYLSNVKDDVFATVNIDGAKRGSYYLRTDDITLDKLEIEIKDEFGNLIDFCNLSFKLEFNLIFSNDSIKIEDKDSSDSISNLIDSDNSTDNKSISSPDISNLVLNNN